MLGPRFSIFSKSANNVKKNSYQMQKLIERKQRRDLRNELEARTALTGMGQRGGTPQSMHFDPTIRSSTSMLSGTEKGPHILAQDPDMARPFGFRADTLKPAQSTAPSFYQPQNDVNRYDVPFGGSFRSFHKSSSSDQASNNGKSSDAESATHNDTKKPTRSRARSHSSGYSISSEGKLDKATKKRGRSGSVDHVTPTPHKAPKDNNSMSFGDSDGSMHKNSDDGEGSDHDQLLDEKNSSPTNVALN